MGGLGQVKLEGGKSRASLGRKGAETRARLLAATRGLLKTISPFNLTVAAIAKEAKTVPGTLYVYFDDVTDVFYALSMEAREDFEKMTQSNLEWFTRRDRLIDDVQAFVEEFHRIWDVHGHVLHYRNLESDRGNERFQMLRMASAVPIIERLAKAVREGRPELSKGEALADAVVLLSTVERIAASRLNFGAGRPGPADAELIKALVRVIARHLGAFDPVS